MDNIGDDLVLLSLHPGSGRLRTSDRIAYGLMGSELVRLVAADRIDISGGRLVVRSSAPTGDSKLDEALATISQARRPPRAQRWVGHPRDGIASAYLHRLADAGVLRKERALLTRWRIADAARLAEAQARVDAIARSAGPVDLAQAALGGLAHAIGLDAALYPGSGNRGLRRRFKDIADGVGTAADAGLAGIGSSAVHGPGHDGPAPHRAGHQAAAHHAAAEDSAAQHAAVQQTVTAATQAAVQAATEAAVHAAVHAAVDASVSAAHSAGAAGHGGHGGH